MDILSIVVIALALSMDAFAVSVASGVVLKEQKVRHALRIALFFGGFQALMPLIGWWAGRGIEELTRGVEHWLAFGLLSLIGGKMIVEAFRLEPAGRRREVLGLPTLLALSVATSLDALAVGVSLSLSPLQVPIAAPIIVIGAITFAVCLVGVLIGDTLGHLFESRIEAVGGLVLIGIGLKILLEQAR